MVGLLTVVRAYVCRAVGTATHKTRQSDIYRIRLIIEKIICPTRQTCLLIFCWLGLHDEGKHDDYCFMKNEGILKCFMITMLEHCMVMQLGGIYTVHYSLPM